MGGAQTTKTIIPCITLLVTCFYAMPVKSTDGRLLALLRNCLILVLLHLESLTPGRIWNLPQKSQVQRKHPLKAGLMPFAPVITLGTMDITMKLPRSSSPHHLLTMTRRLNKMSLSWMTMWTRPHPHHALYVWCPVIMTIYLVIYAKQCTMLNAYRCHWSCTNT